MSNWIEWKGGEKPVDDDVIVDTKDRDGTVLERYPAAMWNWGWDEVSCSTPDDNIIAYRISKLD